MLFTSSDKEVRKYYERKKENINGKTWRHAQRRWRRKSTIGGTKSKKISEERPPAKYGIIKSRVARTFLHNAEHDCDIKPWPYMGRSLSASTASSVCFFGFEFTWSRNGLTCIKPLLSDSVEWHNRKSIVTYVTNAMIGMSWFFWQLIQKIGVFNRYFPLPSESRISKYSAHVWMQHCCTSYDRVRVIRLFLLFGFVPK